jgi:dUTP pyrophosphatase
VRENSMSVSLDLNRAVRSAQGLAAKPEEASEAEKSAAEKSAVVVRLARDACAEGLSVPAYATPGSAGMDVCAAIESVVSLAPGGRTLVPTGLRLEIPEGFEAQVRSRSGLALKHGVCVLNSPGTIDSDYRGELGVVLINHGSDVFDVTRGMRIAQLVFAPALQVTLEEVSRLSQTAVRKDGGFGSTGL